MKATIVNGMAEFVDVYAMEGHVESGRHKAFRPNRTPAGLRLSK